MISSRCRFGNAAEAGFTLVEITVVLVVAAILVAAAVPGMRDFSRTQARAALMNDLNASLRFARAKAIENRRATALCAIADGTDGDGNDINVCNDDAAADFTGGWLVFEDTDGNGERAATEPELRVFTPGGTTGATLQLRLTATGGESVNARRVVSFDQYGRLRLKPGRANPRTHFVYCDATGDSGARTLYLTFAGAPVLAADADGNGKDDYAEEAFQCA